MVQLYGSLREFSGLCELNLEVSEGSTLHDLMAVLAARFGPRFDEVRNKDPFEGYVKGDGSSPSILINGHAIDPESGLGVRLRKGDIVVIIPLIAGG